MGRLSFHHLHTAKMHEINRFGKLSLKALIETVDGIQTQRR